MNDPGQIFTTRGFAVLALVVFGILIAVAFADTVLAWRKPPTTVGDYVNAYVNDHHWIAFVTSVVFGAMVAHFFIYITNR